MVAEPSASYTKAQGEEAEEYVKVIPPPVKVPPTETSQTYGRKGSNKSTDKKVDMTQKPLAKPVESISHVKILKNFKLSLCGPQCRSDAVS